MARKISAMHKEYGVSNNFCRDCCNFKTGEYHGKTLRKCAAYGMTHSATTDWAGSYPACGLFNHEFDESRNTLIEVLKRSRHEAENVTVDGQIEMMEGDYG